MAVILDRADMAYTVRAMGDMMFYMPRHRTIARVRLNAGNNIELSDTNQPVYQTLTWMYDSSWVGQYALLVSKINDNRYQLKRTFADFPAMGLSSWNPTVECLQYNEDSDVSVEGGWASFAPPSQEWAPSPAIGEWTQTSEFQSWTTRNMRFPTLTATETTYTHVLHVNSVPPDGEYTLRSLRELGYAELRFDTVTATATLQTAQRSS